MVQEIINIAAEGKSVLCNENLHLGKQNVDDPADMVLLDVAVDSLLLLTDVDTSNITRVSKKANGIGTTLLHSAIICSHSPSRSYDSGKAVIEQMKLLLGANDTN